MSTLTDSEHANAVEWFRKQIGLSLSADKKYLVETRLEPVAYQYGFASVQELLGALTCGDLQNQDLMHAVFSAITTHETSFFRDLHPFSYFSQTYFPELLKCSGRDSTWAVWSAACSSGQEIYSLIMLILEEFPELAGRKLTLDATDVSPHTLEKARTGEYTQAEVGRGLQARLLLKYFNQTTGGNWVIDENIRKRVNLFHHNLIESWSALGSYDVILMRNVLIYFDVDLKRFILNRLKQHLKPGGLLFLGSSETTTNLDLDWKVNKVNETIFYTLD